MVCFSIQMKEVYNFQTLFYVFRVLPENINIEACIQDQSIICIYASRLRKTNGFSISLFIESKFILYISYNLTILSISNKVGITDFKISDIQQNKSLDICKLHIPSTYVKIWRQDLGDRPQQSILSGYPSPLPPSLIKRKFFFLFYIKFKFSLNILSYKQQKIVKGYLQEFVHFMF